MRKIRNALRLVALVPVALAAAHASAQGQTATRDYSDSDARVAARTRTTTAGQRTPLGDMPTDILRAARTVYVRPNRHIDAEYLEYKLDKLPEFGQWQLSFVKDGAKADLVLEISKTALNYIFSIVEPASSIVVAKGKVVAINGRVAAEDISHQIVKRMRAVRALPARGR